MSRQIALQQIVVDGRRRPRSRTAAIGVAGRRVRASGIGRRGLRDPSCSAMLCCAASFAWNCAARSWVRRAKLVDDALAQQVLHRLAVPRLVCGKQVVERRFSP